MVELVDSIREVTDPVSDRVSKAYESTVLEKKATSYDYSTQTIQYTLTVNKNRMEMNKVTVSDVLDDRLELTGATDVSGDFSGFSDNTKGNNLNLYFETCNYYNQEHGSC